VLVRSVPLDGGAINPEQLGGDSASPLGSLLGATPRADVDLPCRTGDADLWFAEAPADLERAKTLCADCPIRDECLAGALDRREPWGVWGGQILDRGQVIARKRPRGRPSKAALARDRELAAAGLRIA
jgi:WhiB family transcriptional regulator, redox-sensing transcriptional regulator